MRGATNTVTYALAVKAPGCGLAQLVAGRWMVMERAATLAPMSETMARYAAFVLRSRGDAAILKVATVDGVDASIKVVSRLDGPPEELGVFEDVPKAMQPGLREQWDTRAGFREETPYRSRPGLPRRTADGRRAFRAAPMLAGLAAAALAVVGIAGFATSTTSTNAPRPAAGPYERASLSSAEAERVAREPAEGGTVRRLQGVREALRPR